VVALVDLIAFITLVKRVAKKGTLMNNFYKLILTISICAFTAGVPKAGMAQSNNEEAYRLMKILNEKELSEGVSAQHQSEIIKSSTPSCNTVLMMHGLYESKYYMKGITNYFSTRGFNVVHLLSSGHFRPNDPRMEKAKYSAWRNDAIVGLNIAKNLSSNVFLFGYSTGGTMAADLAINHPESIKGLFLFAPALKLTGRTEFLVSSGKLIQFFPSESCDGDKLSRFCKIIGSLSAGSVRDSVPLLKEGLSWSPLAGVEVLNYIRDIGNNMNAAKMSRLHQYDRFDLLDAYQKIKAPLFLAVDQGDLTVDTDFSLDVFDRLQQKKTLLLYPEDQGVAHTNIIKYPQDAYKFSPEFYNHHTKELEGLLDGFLTDINPSCQ
jgi:pimeloyl-ACP methyl ester carboxylesterase